ncbi:MAG: NAD(+)/NADH kinase [Proteobacteria bacterium]|nr:NAD(+)/NADH kinase [Pseudomonadota bacterium]
MDVRSVGICLKVDQPQAVEPVGTLVDFLDERGVRVLADPECARQAGLDPTSRLELAAQSDLIVVLGGDGTLLSVAREIGTAQVPILGVNLGTLGYLTEINVEELLPAFERLLKGDFEIETRLRLEVVVRRGEREVGRFQALNDAVISKSAMSRMIDLETLAEGRPVTTYHSDGLIIATPTGSTAYSLSAGGPILMTGIGAFILNPICPHSLNHRPVVIPQSAEIEVRVHTRGGEVALTVDGQEFIALEEGDTVLLHRSPHPVEIVASPFRSRWEVMRTKLGWGER